MSVTAEGQARLDINRVIRLSLLVLQRNWRSLVRPGLLYLYLPAVLVGLFGRHGGLAGEMTGAPLLALLAAILEFVLYALFEGALFRLAVADLNDESISTDDALRVGRERMWAMAGLILLAGLGVAAGLALLIVPGVLLALAWSVTGPVLIEERRPIMETFGRSAELTRNSRLNIFGLALLILVAEVIGAIGAAILGAPFPRRIAEAFVFPLYSAAAGIAAGVVVAVVYDELRKLRDGRPAEAAVSG